MQVEEIKKKLFFETGVSGGILVFLAVSAYLLTMLMENYNTEKGQLEAELAAVKLEKTTLETKYQKIQKNGVLYAEIADKYAAEKLSIGRTVLLKQMNDFRTRYFFNSLSLNMSPEQDLTGSKYRYKFSTISSSDLTATFDAVSDEDIYHLIHALQEELPGSVRISQLKLERVSKVTDESLRSIAKNGQYTMVKGDMKFTWFGIKPTEAALDSEGKK